MKATIVIPTVDRRSELERAVRGCLCQSMSGAEFEILVIDNSLRGSQIWILQAVAEFGSSKGAIVRYIHEPKSGLSQARNAGIAEARGDYIVFLDDDEVPQGESWLAELISAIESTNADAAFGPVKPSYATCPSRYAKFLDKLYTRDLKEVRGADVSARRHLLGSGNSCFCSSSCFPPAGAWFNIRYNATGGEDIEFIRRLVMAGKHLVWSPGATVEEFVPKDRMTLEYLRIRRFAKGQMRSSVQIAAPPKRYDLLLIFMVAGAVQYGYHATAAIIARIFGHAEAADIHAIQSYGGLGKIFWQRNFRKRRYGMAQIDN